jgi:hypothetical protein
MRDLHDACSPLLFARGLDRAQLELEFTIGSQSELENDRSALPARVLQFDPNLCKVRVSKDQDE